MKGFYLFASLAVALLSIPAFAARTALALAYPAEGTIISGQVGLVLEKTDILKKHGFDAHVSSMGTGRELKTALVSGKADVIMTSETNFVMLLGNGYESYAINSLGSAGKMALVVKADSPVRSVAELKGKKVATIFGTSIHEPALEWLEEAGAREDSHVIDIGSMGALQSALLAGTVDAIMAWDPFLQAMIETGKFRSLRQAEFDLITVSSKSFHDDPDAVSRLNAAMREAVVYFATHKAEVNGWFSAQSRLSEKIIDGSSRANRNYFAKRAEDVSLGIGELLLKKLMRSASFLHGQKFISSVPEIPSHVVP